MGTKKFAIEYWHDEKSGWLLYTSQEFTDREIAGFWLNFYRYREAKNHSGSFPMRIREI